MLRFISLGVVAVVLSVGCGGSSIGGSLYPLAESYPNMSPSEAKSALDRLTVNEHWVLELVGKQFKGAVFQRACEADGTLVWKYLSDGSIYNCAKNLAEWQQFVVWHQQTYGASADPNQNREMGRQEILIYYKCKSGEIDAATCNMYYSIQGQIDQGTAQTTQTIVDNIGNQCTVGVDPGCYP